MQKAKDICSECSGDIVMTSYGWVHTNTKLQHIHRAQHKDDVARRIVSQVLKPQRNENAR